MREKKSTFCTHSYVFNKRMSLIKAIFNAYRLVVPVDMRGLWYNDRFDLLYDKDIDDLEETHDNFCDWVASKHQQKLERAKA